METTEAKELAVVIADSGLDTSKVDSLLASFASNFHAAKRIIDEAKDITVTSEEQRDEMENARHARLELKRIRVESEHTRKKLKEQSLREGKAIDGIANVIKALVVPVEEHLEKQEKFVERLAAERLATRNANRRAKLLEYVTDISIYSYEGMTDEVFNQLIQQLETDKQEKIEAERKAREQAEIERKKAEAERAAREKKAAAEAERIRKENARLRAEAKKREEDLAKSRAAEAQRLSAERAEQQKKLAEERAKAEAERKRREAIEAEAQAKRDAEAKAKTEEEERQRQALLAPDKDKLEAYALQILDVWESAPAVQTIDAQKLVDETRDYLQRVGRNIAQKAKQL